MEPIYTITPGGVTVATPPAPLTPILSPNSDQPYAPTIPSLLPNYPIIPPTSLPIDLNNIAASIASNKKGAANLGYTNLNGFTATFGYRPVSFLTLTAEAAKPRTSGWAAGVNASFTW